MSQPSDLVQGTLDLLILKILALEPLNGWAIGQRLRQVSDDVLQVSDGSLYPALHKLEQEGWITAEWKPTENNRRAKFYSLTRPGRRQLEKEARTGSGSPPRSPRGRAAGGLTCPSNGWVHRSPAPALARFAAPASIASSTTNCAIISSGRSSARRRGHDAGSARDAALRAIGGVEQRKEECATRGVSAGRELVRDLRLALRQMRKQPGFTARRDPVAGARHRRQHRDLPAAQRHQPPAAAGRAPQELVEVRLTGDGRAGRHTGRNRQVSLPQYQELARRQQSFSSLLAFGDTRFNLAPQGEVRYVEGLWVSGSFSTRSASAAAWPLDWPCRRSARLPGGGRHQLRAMAARVRRTSDIVGQPLPDGVSPVTIIGVTPPAFFGVEVGRQFAVARPICASGNSRRDHWWLAAIGRLKPGWTARSPRRICAD